MDDLRVRNRRYTALAWGALFIFVGAVNLIPDIPAGTGMLGIGVILLGLNVARQISGIPTNRVTAALGTIALLLGSLVLLGPALHLPRLELPFFPLALIVIGVVILVRGSQAGEVLE